MSDWFVGIEKTINGLENLREICKAKSDMSVGKGKILWAGYAKDAEDAIALLKEHETKYPVCEKCGKKIDHIITSVFNSYDGSDSEYSFPITYNEDGGCIQFSTTQNWTGYELSDTEKKDSIRCPFCREFPFDANEEIELYEPEEVVVMMWEGR